MNQWARVIEPFGEWVTDTTTAKELWPFSVGCRQPVRGVPVGYDPHTNRLVCYDPLTEFEAGGQRAPQLGIIGANATGKSTFLKRQVIGLDAAGVPAVVAADFKGEYTPLIDRLGGRAQRIGRHGGINLIDPGEVIAAAHERGASEELLTELRYRRNNLVSVVLAITRDATLQDWERALLGLALDRCPPGSTIAQLPQVFSDRLDDLAAAMNVPVSRAAELIEPITLSVMALINSPVGHACGTAGPHQFWAVGAGGLCVDTQAIPEDDRELTAAIMLTCWTAALSTIHLSSHYDETAIHAVVFEEIWRATRQFPDLADRIGGLLRMDRHHGLVTILATHSWSDTEQRGGSNILARCAAFAIGGLQPEEVDLIATAGVGLTTNELATIRSNVVGGTSNGQTYGGLGRFLLKKGDQNGQLVQTVISPEEQELTNTNRRFESGARDRAKQTSAWSTSTGAVEQPSLQRGRRLLPAEDDRSAILR